jgi:hypothetical protein
MPEPVGSDSCDFEVETVKSAPVDIFFNLALDIHYLFQ